MVVMHRPDGQPTSRLLVPCIQVFPPQGRPPEVAASSVAKNKIRPRSKKPAPCRSKSACQPKIMPAVICCCLRGCASSSTEHDRFLCVGGGGAVGGGCNHGGMAGARHDARWRGGMQGAHAAVNADVGGVRIPPPGPPKSHTHTHTSHWVLTAALTCRRAAPLMAGPGRCGG